MRCRHLSRRARVRPASTVAALFLLAGCGGDGTTEPDPVAPNVPEEAEEVGFLARDAAPVLFDYRRDTVEIDFWVVGGDSLVWSLTPTGEEITVDPPGGLAVPGDSVVVSVRVDREDLALHEVRPADVVLDRPAAGRWPFDDGPPSASLRPTMRRPRGRAEIV